MMMELACVMVLAFASLVTATPYGYGVKGGAGARADARATSGAFGGYGAIPLSIPSGSSYSGSYSNSASSSFASSSASSNTFSYSGSGAAPGYGPDINTKCSTGNCQTGNHGNTGGLHGSGRPGIGQVFSGANSAAGSSAGAIVFPGAYGGYNTPCIGNACNYNKHSCEGPNCRDSSSTDNKCKSSNCGSGTQSGTPVSGYGTDDIPVFVSGSESTPIDKKDVNTGANCAFGNCGSTSSSNSPTTPIINQPSTTLITPKEDAPCTSPSCVSSSDSDYDKNKPTSYNVPILGGYSSPNNPCTSGDCGSEQPKHPSTGPNAPGICTSGNCAEIPSTSTSPNKFANISKEDYLDILPLAVTDKPVTSSSGAPVLPNSKIPDYSHSVPTNGNFANSGAAPGANAGSYGLFNPNSVAPTTKKTPVYTGTFGGPPGLLTPNNAPSKVPASPYKPIVPEEATNHESPHKPSRPTDSYSPATIPSGFQLQPISPPGSSIPTCTFGNCASSPQHDSNGSHKPIGPTGSYIPSNTPGSGPTGCTGNCGSSPIPQFEPSSSYNPTGSANSYHPTSGSLNPTGCASGNCGSQPSQSPHYYGSSYKPSEPSGAHYPPASLGQYSPTECSSGNCGTPSAPHGSNGLNNPSGPTGLYNPTAPSGFPTFPSELPTLTPVQSPPHYGQSDTNKPTAPTGSYFPSGSGSLHTSPSASPTPSACSYGKCGSQPVETQDDSYKPSGPAWSNHPTSSSGLNRPTGCASGNCGPQLIQPSPQLPSGSYTPTVSTGSYGCTSGNCGAQPSPSQLHYGQSGSYNPAGPSGQGSYNPVGSSGSYNPTGCSSSNCAPSYSTPQYTATGPTNNEYNPSAQTPGFGGPSGIPAPTGAYSPTTCTSGNCGSQPGNHKGPIGQFRPTGPAQGFGGPPGILKPNDFNAPSNIAAAVSTPTSLAGSAPVTPTGQYNPTCTSGKCSAQPGHSSSSHYGQGGASDVYTSAGAAASANSVYSGGFGGPPGVLKPFDDGKLVSPSSLGGPGSAYGAYTGGAAPASGIQIHSSYGKSLNGGVGATAGAAAQASAVVGSSGGYGGKKLYGGDDFNISVGCQGGCGSDSGFGVNGAATKSVANAVSSAGAYSESFASSSASAHATAGAATKSSYGKR